MFVRPRLPLRVPVRLQSPAGRALVALHPMRTPYRRSRKTMRLAGSVGLVAALLTACAGSSSSASPATTAAGAPASSPAATTGSARTVPADLAGTWAFEAFERNWTIALAPDGKFVLKQGGAVDMKGDFEVEGNRITFVEKEPGPAGSFCGEDPYTYEWASANDKLTLTRVEDTCEDRWALGAKELRRAP